MQRSPASLLPLLWLCLGAAAAVTAHAATAAAPGGRLNGTWQLDTAASDDPQRKLEEAIATRREPRRRRESQLDEAFVPDEPVDPRRETDAWREALATPARLTIKTQGTEIQVAPEGAERRTCLPGEPYARVDSRGTARISCAWKGAGFEVRERYQRFDRGGSRTESYGLDRSGRLQYTRIIQMPQFGTITIRSVYVRTT